MTYYRVKTGRAGKDRRGLWVNDELTGTQARLGNISPELAAEFARQGNKSLMRETIRRPVFGVWVSKEF